MDALTPEQRSQLMSRVRSKDTGPEKAARSILHALGFRFRLHSRSLPGTPDIVLPKYRTVVLVHGCFWHAHACRAGRPPSTRQAFWAKKRVENRERDIRVRAALRSKGWCVVVVWQCELRRPERLAARLERVIRDGGEQR